MKIIFVCSEYPPTIHGGIGIFVKEIAEGLVEHGHEVSVIGYDPLIKTNQTKFENRVKVTRLRQKKIRYFRLGILT